MQCFCFAPDFPCPKRNYLHFNIVNPSGGYYNNAYFGTIHPDGVGNMTMVFNYSGYLTYAGTNYLSQRVTLAPQATSMTAGAFSEAVWRLTPTVAGGITRVLPGMEVTFGSVACTRTPADRGTQVSEKLDIPLRLNHRLSV